MSFVHQTTPSSSLLEYPAGVSAVTFFSSVRGLSFPPFLFLALFLLLESALALATLTNSSYQHLQQMAYTLVV